MGGRGSRQRLDVQVDTMPFNMWDCTTDGKQRETGSGLGGNSPNHIPALSSAKSGPCKVTAGLGDRGLHLHLPPFTSYVSLGKPLTLSVSVSSYSLCNSVPVKHIVTAPSS